MLEVLALQIVKAQCATWEMYDSKLLPCMVRPEQVEKLEAPLTYACYVYLVCTDKRLILVDTGFNAKCVNQQYHGQDYRSAVSGLALLGLTPSQITDVVITHGHWANISGLANFLHARLFISEREVNAMDEGVSGGPNPHQAYRWEDLRLIGLASHLHLVKHGIAVCEDLRVDVVGGHSRGFMVPTVMHHGVSRLILASDDVPMYGHLQKRPYPKNWCRYGSDILERLKLHTKDAFILPGRDPAIATRFPQVHEGIWHIFSSEIDD